MATVDETKSRLLRGVVQDNIDVLQNVKARRLNRRKRFVRPWILAGLLFALGAYVIQPALLVSTAPTPAGGAVALATGAVTLGDIDLTPESSTPLTNPRPIDRAAIPLAIKRIVIDPGHGGEPGAQSESGVTEKEITLDVALRLRRLMAHDPYEVLLTRETDRLISLEKRVNFANEHKADLFVSIHANWMEPKTIRALESYDRPHRRSGDVEVSEHGK